MTVLVSRALTEIGVEPSDILLEIEIGTEEIDCIAAIGGTMAVMELKDKHFAMGNAYSFGAKLGLTKPDHAIVISTSTVGRDVRSHFSRVQTSDNQDVYGRRSGFTMHYIERLEDLQDQLEDVAATVYRQKAAKLLTEAFAVAHVAPGPLLDAIETTGQQLE